MFVIGIVYSRHPTITAMISCLFLFVLFLNTKNETNKSITAIYAITGISWKKKTPSSYVGRNPFIN